MEERFALGRGSITIRFPNGQEVVMEATDVSVEVATETLVHSSFGGPRVEVPLNQTITLTASCGAFEITFPEQNVLAPDSNPEAQRFRISSVDDEKQRADTSRKMLLRVIRMARRGE